MIEKGITATRQMPAQISEFCKAVSNTSNEAPVLFLRHRTNSINAKMPVIAREANNILLLYFIIIPPYAYYCHKTQQ